MGTDNRIYHIWINIFPAGGGPRVAVAEGGAKRYHDGEAAVRALLESAAQRHQLKGEFVAVWRHGNEQPQATPFTAAPAEQPIEVTFA
jgi:hypothetical protein